MHFRDVSNLQDLAHLGYIGFINANTGQRYISNRYAWPRASCCSTCVLKRLVLYSSYLYN